MSQCSSNYAQPAQCFGDDVELQEDAILLTTVLASLPKGKQVFTLEDLVQSKTAPTTETIIKIISQLKSHGYVEEVEQTTENLREYRVNAINNDKELQSLVKKVGKSSSALSSPIYNLLKMALISECIEFINRLLKNQTLSHSEESKHLDKLTRILEHSPLSIVHMYLWRAAKNIVQSDLRLALASEETLNPNVYIIEKAYYYHMQQHQSDGELKKFKRRADYQESVFSKVLFRYHLKMPNYYNNFSIPKLIKIRNKQK